MVRGAGTGDFHRVERTRVSALDEGLAPVARVVAAARRSGRCAADAASLVRLGARRRAVVRDAGRTGCGGDGCDRARFRRGELAQSRLRWRLGGGARRGGRGGRAAAAVQLRLPGRLERGVPRAFRRPAAEKHRARLRRHEPARRGDDHAGRDRGRWDLRALAGFARGHSRGRRGGALHRPAARPCAGRPSAASVASARQAVHVDLPAKSGQAPAGRHRPVARSRGGRWTATCRANAGCARRADQGGRHPSHRDSADRPRDFIGRGRIVSTRSTTASC